MAGLLDILQSASNTAASNISGPVDLIAWALRKAGVPIPEDAVGSSAWMERQGLTRPVKPGAKQVIGDTAGLLSPIAAAAKAPQIARGLLNAAENAAKPNTLGAQRGAVVWHGSPHKFDRFDSSKIGTGEGAQAYGHGLYLAESPEVAMGYRASVAPKTGQQFGLDDGPIKGIATLIAARGQKGEEMARKAYARSLPDVEAAIAQAKAAIDNASSLYKVDLPDDKIARMLDWDKPLFEQPSAVQGLAKLWGTTGRGTGDLFGDQFLKEAQSRFGGAAGAADALRARGVPGVRYLDGLSRSREAGTSNYVVFPGEESILKILERNGIPLGGL